VTPKTGPSPSVEYRHKTREFLRTAICHHQSLDKLLRITEINEVAVKELLAGSNEPFKPHHNSILMPEPQIKGDPRQDFLRAFGQAADSTNIGLENGLSHSR
jgi:hypothetical protein